MRSWTKVKLARVDVETEKDTNLNGLVPKHGGDKLPLGSEAFTWEVIASGPYSRTLILRRIPVRSMRADYDGKEWQKS